MTKDEITLLIAIPLAVSIVANLLTPAVVRTLSSAFTGLAKSLNILGSSGVRLRLRQLQRDLDQLDSLTQDPKAVALFIGEAVLWQVFMLWIFVIAIAVAVVFAEVESVRQQIRLLVPGAFGAGGIQTFISSITTMNLLGKVKQPEPYRQRLVARIDELKAMLPPA